MKTFGCKLCAAALCLAAIPACLAQVSSGNVVGYINRSLSPGDNLITDQLINLNGGMTLNEVVTGTVPDGASFTEWDPSTDQLLPYSFYSASSDSWSINYTLDLGQAGILHSPVSAIVTFVGQVDAHDDGSGNFVFDYVPPSRGPGLYLVAYGEPINASFQDVVGRDPLDGEWVQTLDQTNQVYSRTTFHTDSGWDNGTPDLAVGQAAWFDLGPTSAEVPALVPAPEPALAGLAGLAALVLGLGGRRAARRRG